MNFLVKLMSKRNKQLQIFLAASAGGHLSQLLKLHDICQGYDSFYVSTDPVVVDKLKKLSKTYIVGECNRQHPLKTLMVMAKCIKIVLKERPSVVISTGAAPGCLLCIIAKIFGAKIVWLDSIANTEKLSLSGSIIRPFANLILSQWPEVAAKYKNVEFCGAVI